MSRDLEFPFVDSVTNRAPVPPKVCLVAPLPPPYGGIGRWTEMITQYAQTTGKADIQLVNNNPRWKDPLDFRPWRRVLMGSMRALMLALQVVWRLARGCQVLHITSSGQFAIYRDIAMMRLARIFGVPILYHLRFGRIPDLAEADAPEWRRLTKALRLATTIIPIDQRTEAALRSHLPGLDLRRIPNCADVAALPAPATQPGDPLTVLYLGWVIPAKGIEELLQAWTGLQASGWRLVIAGPYEAAFREQLNLRYAPAGVEFTGPLEHGESMALMASADLFVLPSHTEGFPNVLAEAMALARPIVATAVGAIPEMLEGGCGRVVPPQDAVALQAALGDLMADMGLRGRLGRAALDKLRSHYTLEAVFAELLNLWQEKAS